MMDRSSHRNIITYIHNKWHDGAPFAIWEVRDGSGFSTTSVVRTLRQLVKLRMVQRSNKGFMGKHYRITVRWPVSAKDAIENFELSKAIGI